MGFFLTGWLTRSPAVWTCRPNAKQKQGNVPVLKQALRQLMTVKTCLTWRTLQCQVFVLHFNQHFNMPWSGGGGRKKNNNEWELVQQKKGKEMVKGGGEEEEEEEEHLSIVTDAVWSICQRRTRGDKLISCWTHACFLHHHQHHVLIRLIFNYHVSSLTSSSLRFTIRVLPGGAAPGPEGRLRSSVLLAEAPALGHLVGTGLSPIVGPRWLGFSFGDGSLGRTGEHLVLQAGLPTVSRKATTERIQTI